MSKVHFKNILTCRLTLLAVFAHDMEVNADASQQVDDAGHTDFRTVAPCLPCTVETDSYINNCVFSHARVHGLVSLPHFLHRQLRKLFFDIGCALKEGLSMITKCF